MQQIYNEKFEDSGKFQNNVINVIKQILSNCVIIFFICSFLPNKIYLISLKFDISKTHWFLKTRCTRALLKLESKIYLRFKFCVTKRRKKEKQKLLKGQNLV